VTRFLLEYSVDGAAWQPEGDGHQTMAYLTLLKIGRERAHAEHIYARISNLDLGCLLINIEPDGLGCGVEPGTVT
jgi:hypothetical protein